MNKNKIFIVLIFVLGFGILFSSCYKEENWTEENTEILGYIPIIASFDATPASTVKSGENLSLDLRFWCTDPIKEIIFYPTLNDVDLDSLVYPYSDAAYSAASQTDSLVIGYIAPNVDSTSTLVVNAKVISENGYERKTSPSGRWYRVLTKPVTVTVEP